MRPLHFIRHLFSYLFWWKKLTGRKRFLGQVVTFTVLIAFNVVVAQQVLFPQKASAAWFNDSWAFRKSIAITAHTAAETNVYINLTGANDIDTSDTTKFQADCGDLRFTKQNGELLPYYIVSGCGTTDTVVHVQFNSFPAGPQTIYYYYGNPSVANGFTSADFATEASSYTIGSQGSEEKAALPVAHWKFDEGTGTTVNDSTANNHTGTVSGATWITDGSCITNNCLSFDGSNDYVTVPDTDPGEALDVTQPITVSAWINGDTFGSGSNENRIVLKGAGASGLNLYTLEVDEGNVRFLMHSLTDIPDTGQCSGADGQKCVRGATALQTGQWYHVVGKYDGNTSLQVYVNGRLDGTVTLSGISGGTANASPVVIGGRSDSAVDIFDGFIDDVKIYNFSLSDAQIKANYTSRGGNVSAAVLGSSSSDFPNDPLGYWNMEEGQGSTVLDKSGNGHNGTITGGVWINGKYGKALRFPSNGNRVAVSSLTGELGSVLTVEAWIDYNPLNASDFNRVVARGWVGNGWLLGVFNTAGVERAMFGIGQGGTQYNAGTSSGVAQIAPGKNHLVGVYDGSTTYLYINGVLAASNTGAPDGASLDTTSDIQFANSVSQPMTIDNVRIYDYALTRIQISALHNNGAPIGHWKFNEGQGTTVNNAGSLGGIVNGTMSNFAAPPTASSGWLGGKIGRALEFDATDDSINVGSATEIDDLPTKGGMTFSFWMNADGLGEGGLGRVFDKRTSSNTGWQLFADTVNSRTSLSFEADFSTSDMAVSVPVSLNEWMHVAYTWDGTTTSTGTFYINGRATELIENTLGSGTYVSDAARDLYMGNRSSGDRTFDGTLDEVRIYNYVLTADEVRKDMNQGKTLALGVLGTASDGVTPSNSTDRMYCPPGDTTSTCGPVGEWRFEEGTGSSSTDISGNENTVTFDGAGVTEPSWEAGKVGKAIRVNETDDTQASAADSTSLSPTSTVAMSVWFKPEAIQGGTGSILEKRGAYELRLLGNNEVSFTLTTSGGATNLTETNDLVVNKWYHIVATYDGATMKLYFDGVLVEEVSKSGTIIDSAQSLRIGVNGGTGNSVTGLIDEAKVYNYALSASQVSWDYNRGKPLAHYKFDECQGSILNDSSGNGLHGTISAGAAGETTVGTCSTASTMWGSGGIGKSNGSIEFDSTDDNVNAGSNVLVDDLPTKGGLSISAWINADSIGEGGAARIVDKRTSSNTGWQLFITDSSGSPVIAFQADHASTDMDRRTAVGLVSFDQWIHVIYSWNGTTSGGVYYINGRLAGTSLSTSGSGAYVSDASVDLYIGNRSGGDRTFDGQIDDVRIFNYPVTAAQAKVLYNQSSAVLFAPLTGTP